MVKKKGLGDLIVILICALIITAVFILLRFGWFGRALILMGFAIFFIIGSSMDKGKKWLWAIICVLVIFAFLFIIYSQPEKKAELTGISKLVYGVFSTSFSFAEAQVNWLSTKLFGISVIDGVKRVIGIRDFWSGFGNFWINFLIGLVAGFLIYAGSLITRTLAAPINNWLRGAVSNPNLVAKYIKEDDVIQPVWLDFLAGSPGKILIIALTYAAVMQIAFLNRAIEIITFYHLTPLLLKPVVLAIIIGYLPAIVESLIKYREYRKAYKKVMEVKAGIATARMLGKT